MPFDSDFVQVEKDFEMMFPDKVNSLFEKWPQLSLKVLLFKLLSFL